VADVGTDTAVQQQCVGGCNDFTVSDPSIGAGTPVTVVIPLSADVPSNAVYRKQDTNGNWFDFDNNGGAVFTAPAITLAPLVCPAAGSSSYVAGLTAGHRCLQIRIINDGPNDSELVAPNTIADPGGIGVPVPQTAPSSRISSPNSGGCSIATGQRATSQHGEWWLLFGFLAWLGWSRRKQESL
jgi:hypothetical protein